MSATQRQRHNQPAAEHAAGDRREQEIELTYCVVNTGQRELLLRGLDAIASERAALPFATEVLVLDNDSRDGSARAAGEHPTVDGLVALSRRRGKALNDSELLRRARGRYALLPTGALGERRIVEMARNRDLYMRKHHSRAAAAAVRWLTAWAYALRALAALLLPGHSPRRYWRHVLATLKPTRGEGLREAAEEHNRG